MLNIITWVLVVYTIMAMSVLMLFAFIVAADTNDESAIFTMSDYVRERYGIWWCIGWWALMIVLYSVGWPYIVYCTAEGIIEDFNKNKKVVKES